MPTEKGVHVGRFILPIRYQEYIPALKILRFRLGALSLTAKDEVNDNRLKCSKLLRNAIN